MILCFDFTPTDGNWASHVISSDRLKKCFDLNISYKINKVSPKYSFEINYSTRERKAMSIISDGSNPAAYTKQYFPSHKIKKECDKRHIGHNWI